MQAIKSVVEGLVEFTNNRQIKKADMAPLHNPKYKTSMCRDLAHRGKCPRGQSCTFAHSQEEMEK
jgi:RING finger/CCCH-type zinc finger protein